MRACVRVCVVMQYGTHVVVKLLCVVSSFDNHARCKMMHACLVPCSVYDGKWYSYLGFRVGQNRLSNTAYLVVS